MKGRAAHLHTQLNISTGNKNGHQISIHEAYWREVPSLWLTLKTKPYSLSFCFNLKNVVIINICHLRTSQPESRTRTFYQARCRISLDLSQVTKLYSCLKCSYPKHFRKYIVSLLFWDAQGCVRSRMSENSYMGLVLQGAPLSPSSNYVSAWGQESAGLRYHSPSTQDPRIPCPKWSKARPQELCGSLPSKGQAASWLVCTSNQLLDYRCEYNWNEPTDSSTHIYRRFLQFHRKARKGREGIRLWDRWFSCPGPTNIRGGSGMG